jgi:hypothetical protein
MKNLKLSLCVLVLASFFCALTPSTFAQDGNPEPLDPHTSISVGK